jgi:hypothetical protein
MSALPLLRTVLVLGRVSNLPTVWTNVAVGWFLSGGGWTAELGWLVLGTSLVYVAGMTLNDAFDAAWDREHAPGRPIPAGRIGEGAVWGLGLAEMGVGVAVLLALTTAHPALVGGLVAAVLLYNWLHKRWAGSVLLMGLCRALVYLAAGSAVVSQTRAIEVPTSLLVLAGGAILYIAGLTLVARGEHLGGGARLRLLPRLLLMLPVLFPLVSHRAAPAHPVHLALAVLGVVGVAAWLTIVRRAFAERIPKGVGFAIAGIAFYDAAIVAFADLPAAVACLACFVAALGLQRVVPAT